MRFGAAKNHNADMPGVLMAKFEADMERQSEQGYRLMEDVK